MKALEIAKTVGAGALREFLPGGGLLIDAINEMLPAQHRLPSNATGDDLDATLRTIPSEHRARLMEKEFDVSIASWQQRGETVRAMLAADAAAKHTTRPKVVLGVYRLLVFINVVVVLMWAYGVLTENNTIVRSVMDGWPWVLSVTGPFFLVLHGYFGILRDEDRNRRNAANGIPAKSGVAGFMSDVLTRR